MSADIKQVLEKATARPWKHSMQHVLNKYGKHIAFIPTMPSKTMDENLADAELIVVAVNDFESNRELIRELGEALEECRRDSYHAAGESSLGEESKAYKRWKMADAALAKIREAGL